jgi:hypothetical protein
MLALLGAGCFALGAPAACSSQSQSPSQSPSPFPSSTGDTSSGAAVASGSGSQGSTTGSAGAGGQSGTTVAASGSISLMDAMPMPGDDAADDGDAPASGDGAGVLGFDAGPPGNVDYGGVGQLPLVPLAYTPQPVPPIIPMDCSGDPTQGFTEYKDSFVIQRPYDLAAADRFSYQNGIYTIWVLPNDKPHVMGNTTHGRTEVRYSDMKTGQHLWTGDVMVESPSENVCIFQVKGALGPIGVYLRVNAGNVHQLGGADFMTGIYGKWFNLKVLWDSDTGAGTVWVNNCQKMTVQNQAHSIFYFKHGTYTCFSSICRDHFRNIHVYQKGSTDQYNVKSPIP